GTTVSGSITFCDSDVLGTPERRMRALRGKDIGLIYRDPVAALNPVRTTGVQSREPLRLHVGMSRRQAEECAVELLLRVGIDEPREKLRSYPHESAAACASGW
ncbi:MAG: ABC transporter ATP-binding protein, partial [Pseudonocardia sp.]